MKRVLAIAVLLFAADGVATPLRPPARGVARAPSWAGGDIQARNPQRGPLRGLVSGKLTVFDAPLHTDRIGPGVWDVSGLDEPPVQWWPSDHLGAGGDTTPAFTLVQGATEEFDSPFCNSDGTCLKARHFDVAQQDVYESANGIANLGTGDGTMCALYQSQSTGTHSIATTVGDFVDSFATGGWWLVGSSFGMFLYVYDQGSTSSSVRYNTWIVANSWRLFCASYDADGNMYAYGNGDVDSGSPAIGGTIGSASAPLRIGGRKDTIYTSSLNGDLVFFFYWPSVIGSTQLVALHNAIQAMAADKGSDITFDRNSVAFAGAPDSSGYYHAFGPDMAAQAEDGVSVWGAATNNWTDFCDASAWTDTGTPVVTTDTTAGPFSVYNGGAEADTIEDNSAIGREGKYVEVADATNADFTMSCFFKAGTHDDVRMVLTDETGGTTFGSACTPTITSSFVRYSCTAEAPGTQTAVRAYLLVGVDVSDTGTIIVSGCQLEEASYAGRPCPTGGAAATCATDDLSVSTTGWPTSHGTVSLRYTPEVADGFGVARYLIEAADVTSGWWIDIGAGGATGELIMYQKSAAGAGDYAFSDAKTWTLGTTYEVSVSWTAAGVVTFERDGASAGSDTLTDVADGIDSSGHVGTLTGSSGATFGSIADVKVSIP